MRTSETQPGTRHYMLTNFNPNHSTSPSTKTTNKFPQLFRTNSRALETRNQAYISQSSFRIVQIIDIDVHRSQQFKHSPTRLAILALHYLDSFFSRSAAFRSFFLADSFSSPVFLYGVVSFLSCSVELFPKIPSFVVHR